MPLINRYLRPTYAYAVSVEEAALKASNCEYRLYVVCRFLVSRRGEKVESRAYLFRKLSNYSG